MEVLDPIHGTITLSPLCAAFARHRWFARLKNVQQLGTGSFVFPQATHSRWEHSLGTCHLAQQLVAALQQSGAPIEPWEAEAVALAALLHDVGHGPFSHIFDRFVEPLPLEHEKRSQLLMQFMYGELSAIDPAVAKMSPQQLEWAVTLIDPPELPPAKPFLHEIVSNTVCGMDVDKMDYLMRDHWMLTHEAWLHREVGIMLRRCIVDADGHLAFNICDSPTLIALSERRLEMHRSFYGHPQVEAIGVMAGDILGAFMAIQPITSRSAWVRRIAELDDDIIRHIAEDAQLPAELRQLAHRFLRGQYYRHVCDTTEPQSSTPSTAVIPWGVATNSQAPHRALPRIPFHNGSLARKSFSQGRLLYRTIAK
jgi:HD superfamily phosphohydrolase